MLQQELDKTLETLERERTELEARLREQETETKAIRAQRDEERAEADSTLYRVSSLEYQNLAIFECPVLPLPHSTAGLQWGFLKRG